MEQLLDVVWGTIYFLAPLAVVGGVIDLLWPKLTFPGKVTATMIGVGLLVWWWANCPVPWGR